MTAETHQDPAATPASPQVPAAPAEPPASPPPEGQAQGQAPAGQATTPAPATKPSDATNLNLRAAYTQTTQENAAIKRALGLEKGATVAEIEAAWNARAAQADQPEEQDFDPELASQIQKYRDDAWSLVSEARGAEVVTAAKAIEQMVYEGATPAAITAAIIEAGKLSGQPAPQDGSQQQQAQAQGQQPQPGDPADVQVEGESPVGFAIQPEQDERGSGDVEGAAAKAFASLFRR